MRRVAVIGVGVTKFGKHDRTSAELFAEAARDALADAEIGPAAIQALYGARSADAFEGLYADPAPRTAARSSISIPSAPVTAHTMVPITHPKQ